MEDRTERSAVSATALTGNTRKQLHLVALNFRVPFQVRLSIKAYAVQCGVSMTDVLIAALRNAGVLGED